jgi:vacuole morphology and inheritance protein 14
MNQVIRRLTNVTEEEIQLTALRWIDSFFEICPEDILPFVPQLLAQVLPAMASDITQVRQAANTVNKSLIEYIVTLAEEPKAKDSFLAPPSRIPNALGKDGSSSERRDSTPNSRGLGSTSKDSERKTVDSKGDGERPSSFEEGRNTSPHQAADLDYGAAANSLTLQFLNEHEATRVAALSWLLMLHRKAPRKVG